ncbi:FtsK/SpoIIIE domain-containing protein [Rugosimonospora africana]|uniref:Cell division protein FtsK n=1 Tax=Rugosimonospora africana TaxID=556532 RepID=A0A8J3QVD8_9ACTN|nr:cell division protein FtsK [Rugosimonospora africana]
MADSLIETIRRDLGRAQAAALAGRAAAQRRLADAHARHARMEAAAAQVPQRAGDVREQQLTALETAHRESVADTAADAIRAALASAPGSAGDPWSRWQPTPLRRGSVPGPVRIGTVPPGVPALVPFLDWAHVRITGTDRARCDAVLAALLLRTLGCAPPGSVRLTGYDPDQLGGGLAGFAPLSPGGLLTFVGPGGLGRLLDELVDHVRRVNETVLAGEYPSLRAYAEATGRRPEHWRVAVLLGADEPTRHEQAQLARLLRTGVACGVHLILRGLPVDPIVESDVTTLATVSADRFHGMPLTVEGPPAELVTAGCRTIAAQAAEGPEPIAFADLLPDELWTHSSAIGLTAPVGEASDGELVDVSLADYPPHALIGGPSGTGKTNLIYAWMGGLAARYSPAELEFYLLDFKEGVSFARFAPGQRDPSWLPHVRLVGINVNTDREFGVALLHFLSRQLRARAEAAKRHEVTTLAELRAEDPTGHWPRIVAVVDEFQVLLSGRDALAAEAATLLEDLARRGRSQGIHLVLASQDVSGIEALWGRSALVGQFALRMALPKARRILNENNPAAESIPRFHAVINADSGALPGNRIVRVPMASDRESWSGLQLRLWQRRPADVAPPRLFDGDAVPVFPQNRVPTPGGREPVALLGETIDVAGEPARLRLPRAPGRNLAVLGTRLEEACAVLASAGRSLAAQFPDGSARFSVACLDPDAMGPAGDLHAALPEDTEWYDVDTVSELFAETVDDASGTPHFLILYAVDAARSRAAGPQDHLRRILHSGPERHTHVLGWWRGVGRLRDDLGGMGARLDPIGAWVALDVHGGDLATLYPKPGGPSWYPRPWRALYFDRTVHRNAEAIIPYGLS